MIYQANSARPRVMYDFDQVLIWSVLLLLSIGLIMIYSASIAIAEAQFGVDRAHYYLLRHSSFLVVGFVLGLIVMQHRKPGFIRVNQRFIKNLNT